jgi:hypothetical protein
VKAVLAIAALTSMLAASPAHAQLAVSAGFEYFQWTEDVDPIEVEEKGALFVVGLDYTQRKDKGWLLAYRGRFYTGDVEYDGSLLFFPSVPVSGTTSYLGMSNEVQLRYRFPPRRGSYSVDVLTSAGYDFWERELNDFQQEDYRVAFLRFGVEVNPVGNKGWLLGAGIKYPVWVEEDGHFDDSGYDQNPKLEPGRGASVFGQVGYRFQRHLALIAYLDGYNLRESDPVYVTQGGTPFAFYQPSSMQYNIGLKLQYLF